MRDQLFEVLENVLHQSRHPDGLVFTSFNILVDDEGIVKIDLFGDKSENSWFSQKSDSEL